VNEDKIQGIYFSRIRRPPESHVTRNERNIPFVNNIRYLDGNLIRKLHGDCTYK
jgi:hypothetical protein